MDVRFSETIFEEESAHNPVGQGNTSVQSASQRFTRSYTRSEVLTICYSVGTIARIQTTTH